MIHLIDFGAAQEIQGDKQHVSSSSYTKSYSSDQDQFGTNLEFMAPEVISSGPVGTYTDMWGFGVLLYVALSGLSPFLDDSEDETTNNILRCDYSFPAEYFSTVSASAKELVGRLLTNPGHRPSASISLDTSEWFRCPGDYTIPSIHLSTLVRRRNKKLNTVAPLQPMTRGPQRP